MGIPEAPYSLLFYLSNIDIYLYNPVKFGNDVRVDRGLKVYLQGEGWKEGHFQRSVKPLGPKSQH